MINTKKESFSYTIHLTSDLFPLLNYDDVFEVNVGESF